MSKSSDFKLKLLISILLIVVTAAIYCQVVRFDYICLDDESYITENHNLDSGITGESLRWAFTSFDCYNWHPITWISYLLDVQLYGNNASGHHLTNLILHLANTLLLFLLLARITKRNWPSAFVAAIFALHPLHVESVAWVSERKDVLSTFFLLLTMWAYVSYADKPSFKRYLIVLSAFVFGLMSKPMLVTLPLLLLLIDYWPLSRAVVAGKKNPWKRLVLEKVPLFAITAASSIVTVVAQGDAVQTQDQVSFGIRAANAAVSYFSYILKTIWPTKLSVYYPHPLGSLSVWLVILSIVALIAITALVIRSARKHPYLAVGWLWYTVMLIPVIGLVQVGQQAMADRYTYVPMVGLLIMAAWGFPALVKRFIAGYKLAIPALLAITAMAVLTYIQVSCWQNSTTLFKHALAATSGNSEIRCMYAGGLLRQGEVQPALVELKEALKSNPKCVEAYQFIGSIYADTGQYEDALKAFYKVLEIDPEYYMAEDRIGTTLAIQGKTDEAIEHFRKAIDIMPDWAVSHYNLANMLCSIGNLEEAEKEFRQAIKYDKFNGQAHCNLAVTLGRLGKSDEAVEQLKEALRVQPDLAEAHYYYGLVLQSQNDIDGSIEHLSRAVEVMPDMGMAHSALAIALYQNGDLGGARREVDAARSLGCPVDPRLEKALNQK
jgi:tetratricopeptide (TPR) repeat protein